MITSIVSAKSLDRIVAILVAKPAHHTQMYAGQRRTTKYIVNWIWPIHIEENASSGSAARTNQQKRYRG